MSKSVITRNSAATVEDEGTAGAEITPGMLVARDVNGEYIPHPNAGHPVSEVAVLNQFDPEKDLADPTPAGARVDTEHLAAGVEFQALLADGEAVDETTPLVSDGAGGVRESATDADGNYTELEGVVGYPTEAVSNSSGSYVRVNVKVI